MAFVMEPSERLKKKTFDHNSIERAALLRLYEFVAYLEKDRYLVLHLHLIFPEPGDKS